MRPAENIEKLVNKLRYQSSDERRKRIFDNVAAVLDDKQKRKPAIIRPNVWRIIMKSRITKLAATAVIVMALVFSMTIMDKSVASAYALEKTIAAYGSLRYVNIKDFKDSESEPKEFWVEFDEQEQVKNFRVYIPAWDMPSEGAKIALWKDDKLQVWIKKNNVLLTIHDKARGLEMLNLVKQCDPRSVVEELYQLEAEGKVEIEISEPTLESEPIVITANYLPQSDYAGGQIVLFIDQLTLLVTRAVINQLKGFGGYQHSGRLEYSDYNIEVDESVFTLWEVPDDVMRIDQTGAEVGLVQGQLSDEEIAIELARQFLQALVDHDYDKAGNLFGGVPAKVMQMMGEKMSYTKVLSIEKPISKPNKRSKRTLSVPCVFEIKKDNEVFAFRKNIGVEPVKGKPNVWIVSFDNDSDSAQITVNHSDTTISTFLKNINSNLALLDINKATADNVIDVFGKPLSYQFGSDFFEEDNLPELYCMNYPGYFMVMIHENQVRSWGSEEVPGYTFSDSIQIGSTVDEVLRELGPPAKVVEGFKFGGGKFKDNVLYKNMNGRKGYCYYATISKGKRIRMFFMGNKMFSLHEHRTEPLGAIE